MGYSGIQRGLLDRTKDLSVEVLFGCKAGFFIPRFHASKVGGEGDPWVRCGGCCLHHGYDLKVSKFEGSVIVPLSDTYR